MLERIAIQHAADTGRYHPAFYRWAPFPGPDPTPVERYKSGGHHTEGFPDLPSAQVAAAEIARQLDVRIPDDGGFPVRELDCAGPDILLEAT